MHADKVNKIRYIQKFILSFVYSLEGAFFIKIYGMLDVEVISVISAITGSIALTSVLLNKMDRRLSLLLPKIIITAKIPIYLAIYLYSSMEVFVVVLVVLESLGGLVYNHRSDVVNEIIKEHYNLARYGNNTRSLKAIGSILGSGLAILIAGTITPYHLVLTTVSLEIIILLTTMTLIDKKLNIFLL
jgi:hypothetical protein